MTPHPEEGMLHAFIDGELSAGEATALEAHVAECGLCGAALAEARGFVAGASRAINELDTAPSSASRPVAARPAMTSPARSGSRPFIFRVPFARAAVLLLLAGGSAVVISRSTSDNGATSSTKSVTAEAALTEDRAGSEEMSLSSATPVARVTRYRTEDGVTLTLTGEPLLTSFAEKSTTVRRGVARPIAQASAPAVNSFRWLSAEQGKSFTLSGALSVAELEAASKRLSELERVP